MKYYRFKTNTTSYFFPKVNINQEFLYGLYSALGGNISRLYWWLFRNNAIIRWMNAIDENRLNFPYRRIKELVGDNCLLSFNMGSPGAEQKISILAYDNITGLRFFAKFAEKPDAMALTKNEINILPELADVGIAPALLDYKIANDYVWLKTQHIQGQRLTDIRLNAGIVRICTDLSSLNFNKNLQNNARLLSSFSHGDFCPWNILVNNQQLRLIDWEMAEERPLGYDLFTYIFQTAFLLSKRPVREIIRQNSQWIEMYFAAFNISDYAPYLKSFATEKIQAEIQKGSGKLLKKYQLLFNSL